MADAGYLAQVKINDEIVIGISDYSLNLTRTDLQNNYIGGGKYTTRESGLVTSQFTANVWSTISKDWFTILTSGNPVSIEVKHSPMSPKTMGNYLLLGVSSSSSPDALEQDALTFQSTGVVTNT